MSISTLIVTLSLVLQPQASGRRIINLSRLRFTYQVPDSIVKSVHFADLSQIDSGWNQVDANDFPWHKAQYLAGWQKEEGNHKSGIFIGLQAPVHKLRENEYITNWLFSLHEAGIEDASLTNKYKLLSNLDWDIYEITSNGNGLFLGNGEIPTVMLLAITQLPEDKPSHVFPLILVYGATELENRENFLKVYRKFLSTVTIRKKVESNAISEKTQPITLTKRESNIPENIKDIKISYIPAEKKLHAGLGYTKFISGLNGLTFKLLLAPKFGISVGGYAEFEDTASYDYHLDAVITLFEIKLKGKLYLYLSGGARYYRNGNIIYKGEFPLKLRITGKKGKPAYLMFGLWYSYNESAVMKNNIGFGWGIQVLPFVF